MYLMCTELCMPELFFVCGGAVIRLTCSGLAVSPAPFANLKIINFMLCTQTLHYCIKVPGRDSLVGEGLYSTQGRFIASWWGGRVAMLRSWREVQRRTASGPEIGLLGRDMRSDTIFLLAPPSSVLPSVIQGAPYRLPRGAPHQSPRCLSILPSW